MAAKWIVNENYGDDVDWGEKENQREKRRLQREKKRKQKKTHDKNRYHKRYFDSNDMMHGEDDDFEYEDM